MNARTVRVWDLPVRLFHWLLVALVAAAWWTAEEGGLTLEYHMWCGYAILTLVLFRLMWGVVGSEPARFASFVRGPRRVLAALGEMRSRAPMCYPTHNPAGGWAVVAMLALLAAQAGTGLFANDDLFNEGPLYAYVSKAVSDRLTAVHHLNFNLLSGLIALHVVAVAYHRLRKGEHLVAAMFTGRRELPASLPQPRLASAWRALLLVGFSAGIVAIIVNI